MTDRKRKSIRLKGYDYSGPGDYFITICTHKRRCILGDILDMCFRPSDIGTIVKQCWEAISEHFPQAQVGVFQIIPNHVHGIVSIKPPVKSVGTRHAVSLQENSGGKFGKPRPGSLSTIIRSFKSAVTKQVHELEFPENGTIWQSRFYDHIIRDDIDHYFVQQYIELNPLYWHLDTENPLALDGENSIEKLRNVLVNQLHFDHRAIEYLIQSELDYRVWRNESQELNL